MKNLNELSKRIDKLKESESVTDIIELVGIKQTLTAMLGEFDKCGYIVPSLRKNIKKLIDKINGEKVW